MFASLHQKKMSNFQTPYEATSSRIFETLPTTQEWLSINTIASRVNDNNEKTSLSIGTIEEHLNRLWQLKRVEKSSVIDIGQVVWRTAHSVQNVVASALKELKLASAKDLANSLHISKASINKALYTLEKKGLATHKPQTGTPMWYLIEYKIKTAQVCSEEVELVIKKLTSRLQQLQQDTLECQEEMARLTCCLLKPPKTE